MENACVFQQNIGKSMIFGKNLWKIGKKYREMPKRHTQTTTIIFGARSIQYKQLYLAYRKTHHIMHVVHGLYCHMYLKYHFYLQGNTIFMSFMHKQAVDDLLSVFYINILIFFKIQCIFIHKSCIPILTYVYSYVLKVLFLPIGKYNFQVFDLYIYTKQHNYIGK